MLKVGIFASALTVLGLMGCSHQAVKAPGESQANKAAHKAHHSESSDYQYHGFYTFGQEVNTLTLCGQKPVYWVVADQDVQARLQQRHQALTHKPYEAAYIRFNGRLLNKARDGFAADYDGQVAIDELLLMQDIKSSSCD